jgi:outer membrane protein assembly factor BamB
MIRIAAPLVALIAIVAAVLAPAQTRVLSHPQVPSTEALNRLNLKLGWKTALPVEDSRDGVASVQLVGDRLFAQLRNGAVIMINADTGQQLWRTRVGRPYNVSQLLGTNYDTVFGINGTRLFAIDKVTGRAKWETILPNIPTAAPVADSQRVYVCVSGNRLLVYRLPVPELDPTPPPPSDTLPAKPTLGMDKAKAAEPLVKKAPPPAGLRISAVGTPYPPESEVTTPLSSKPLVATYTPLVSATQVHQAMASNYLLPLSWEYTTDSRLIYPPVVSLRRPDSSGFLLLFSTGGYMYGSTKNQRALVYTFKTESPPSAPIAQYGDIAYICHEDATVLAVNIETGQQVWRLATGGTTRRMPIVTDDDIYISPDRAGLYRLSRASGEVIWRNRQVERFLSSNRKYVYALDARNQLVVLDRARGTPLSSYDLRDFSVPVVNEYSDRMLLTAHDGLLISLHDRDYPAPAWNKQLVEEKKAEPPKKEDKGAEKKEADK